MGGDMVLYGSSKHEEHEVEKIEVSSDAAKPLRSIDMVIGVKSREHENRPPTTDQWTPRILSAVAAAVFSTIAFMNAASEEPTLCSDILYLIEQSNSQFSAIQGDTGSDFGDYDTTLVLPDTWYCAIFDDVEKRSYRCVWKYPLGDKRAHKTFQRFVKEMRSCIGNIAEEHTDQPVNHPDFYASYHYQLPGGGASVSLKNKSKLMSTLVSIRVDGFTKTK